MSFLTLNGTPVNVVESGGNLDWIEIGDRGQVVDGTQESSVRARKRRWTVRTQPLAFSAAEALRSILTNATVTASGDWLANVNTTVFPKLADDSVPETVDTEEVLNFTLEEL